MASCNGIRFSCLQLSSSENSANDEAGGAQQPRQEADVAVQPESSAREIKRLRRCINDLVSILALPATWTGSEQSRIVGDLLGALLSMLSLDFVYARLKDTAGQDLELVRTSSGWGPISRAQEIGEKLQPWLGDGSQNWPHVARVTLEGQEMSVVSLRLGLDGEMGTIVAASRRVDFPQQTEGLVLNVAANQAAIGLREANLLSALDQRVAERTAELVTANEALREAHTRIARSEDRWRSVFENSAIGVALTDLNGRFIAANPLYQNMLGYTEQELEQISFVDITIEEDRDRNSILIEELLKGRRKQFQIEKQYRRKNGSTVWVRNSVSVVPGTERVPRFLMALSEDVTDRKRAGEALKASERELRSIINTIPTLAWSAEANGSVTFLNQRWLDYTGLTTQEANDWGWGVTIHADDTENLLEYWKSRLTAGEPGEVETRLRRHDGVYRWFLIRFEPFRDESGKVLRWYGTTTDIEDRKRAEEKLKASESRFRAIIDTIPTMAWSCEPDGYCDYVNRRWLETTGLSVEEALGWGWGTSIHPDDLKGLVEYWQTCLASGATVDTEARMRRFDGTCGWFWFRASPLRDESGTIVKWYGTNTDIDDRKRAEEELRHSEAKLAHASRITTLGVLTASIAHEISQPLSGIITNAGSCLRMLSADPPNVEGACETTRRTIRDGNRAAEVITRLRKLYSKKELTAEPLDLNEAAREVIALSLGRLQRDQVILRQELTDDLPVVTGDRVQVQQVILNLVLNASDAMSGVNDRPRELLIRTERAGSGVRLTVQDAGIGIQPEAVGKLFEPFYTTKGSGMGIGLSVSRSIIESHHGRIWAEPNDGPGATFSFSIPGPEGVAVPAVRADRASA